MLKSQCDEDADTTKGMALVPSENLRSSMGKTRPARLARAARSAKFLTLPLAATLALSACGSQEVGAAAIVNGTAISDQDVQTVSLELKPLAQGEEGLSPSNVLLSLILAPYVSAEASRAGKTVTVAQARQAIAKVPKPSPATIKSVQMQLGVQQLDPASQTAIVKALGKAKIEINPRYGTYDATQVAISPSAHNWLKPVAAPVAK